MILILFGWFSVAFCAKGGPYYAEPSYVLNKPQTHPETSDYFFYLQQLNKSYVTFRGDVEFKRNVGPLQARLDYFIWTGKVYARPSGGSQDVFLSNACSSQGVVLFLQSFFPQSGFHLDNCSFTGGKYLVEVDWNEQLHTGAPELPYDPQRLIFTILEGDIMLFGLTLAVKFYDENLYKFIPKD